MATWEGAGSVARHTLVWEHTKVRRVPVASMVTSLKGLPVVPTMTTVTVGCGRALRLSMRTW